MKTLRRLMAALLLLVAALVGAIYSGLYNVAADRPDSPLSRWLVHAVTERSVRVRADAIVVPKDLDDPLRIDTGAGDYARLCAGCHLAPGVDRTDLRTGLNPRPPDLARIAGRSDPRELFWITKHGVKMTGMPAWGRSHDDETIWDLVAFLRRLPTMSPARYQELTAHPTPGAGQGPAFAPDSGHGRIP